MTEEDTPEVLEKERQAAQEFIDSGALALVALLFPSFLRLVGFGR